MRRLMKQRSRLPAANRRGSAAVEFALVTPVFLALIIGAVQNAHDIDATHKMYAAIRQSGRLASMNGDGKLQSGQTMNEKVVQDIRNSLTAEGLPGSDVTVTITHTGGKNVGATFDLSDANNDLQYFRIQATVPYVKANTTGFVTNQLSQLKASVVFRKGRKTLVN